MWVRSLLACFGSPSVRSGPHSLNRHALAKATSLGGFFHFECRLLAHRVISLRCGFSRYRGIAGIDQAASIRPTKEIARRPSGPCASNLPVQVPGNPMRQTADLLSRINVIWPVQSCLRKDSARPVGQITFTNSPRPVSQEGRLAIVTKRGAGCGGRGWRL
jgi:hypothetical protein